MKKFLFIVSVAFSTTLFSQNYLDIESTLKNYSGKSLEFYKKLSETSWMVKFQLPDWEYPWYVNIMMEKDPNNPDFNIVYIWTNIAKFERPPSQKLLEVLMKTNADPFNWGTFSVIKGKDNYYYIDYNIKFRHKFLTENELFEAIGWVAGYSEGIYKEVMSYK